MLLLDLFKVVDDKEELCLYTEAGYFYYTFSDCPEYLLTRRVERIYKSTRYIVAELEEIY